MLPTVMPQEVILSSLRFLPELVICLAIVLLLLLRLVRAFDRTHLGGVAQVLTLLALAISVCQWLGYMLEPPSLGQGQPLQMYANDPGGMLVYDHVTVFARCFLYLF